MSITSCRYHQYLKVAVSLLLVIIIIGCRGKESADQENISISFNEEMVIGNDANAPQEELLAAPTQIQTDLAGNIYVADVRRSVINVYDNNGKYIHSIGRKGKGPGEFGSSPIFDITSNDELIVLDMGNRRVMRFSTAGDLLFTTIPSEDEMLWSSIFRNAGSDEFIILKKTRDIGRENSGTLSSNLLHQFDRSFKKRHASFAPVDSMVNSSSDYTDLYLNDNPGSLLLTDSTSLWYAPGIYGGRIYNFRKDNNQWFSADTLQGKMFPSESVIVDTDDDKAMTIRIFTEEGQETVKGLVNSESRGLFRLTDGRLIHFSSQRVADSTQTVVEVFGKNGALAGIGTLAAFDFPGGPSGSMGYALWKDANDRFYFTNNQQAPFVRVGRIEGL